MPVLNDASFAIYDASNGMKDAVDPPEETKIFHPNKGRGYSEKALETLYKHHYGHQVEQINQRRKGDRLKYALGIDESNRSWAWDMPEGLGKTVLERIRDNLPVDSDKTALQFASVNGIPDFITCKKTDPTSFQFVEAKRKQENLNVSQVEWFKKFDFFTIKIAYVFDKEQKRDSFIEENTLEDLLDSAAPGTKLEQMEDRQVLSNDEIARRLQELKVGDKVMFNKRKTPLEVIGKDVTKEVRGSTMHGVQVESIKGNKYILSNKGDKYLKINNRLELKWVEKVTDG